MQIDDRDYAKLINKVAMYRAALKVISGLGVDIRLDIDGWVQMIRQARKTATDALNGVE